MQLNICCIEICSWSPPVISFLNCLHCAGEHCLLTIDSDVILVFFGFFYKPCSCLSGYPLFFPFASS